MRKVHNLKLEINFCDDVLSGDKCFEIRNNDRGFQKGDLVKFVPTDSRRPTYEQQLITHQIENKYYIITYVLSGWGLKENFVVFGIREAQDIEQIKTEVVHTSE